MDRTEAIRKIVDIDAALTNEFGSWVGEQSTRDSGAWDALIALGVTPEEIRAALQ